MSQSLTRIDAGSALDGIPLPFPVVLCHGRDLERCFAAARADCPGAAIVGTRADLAKMLERRAEWRRPEEILQAADGLIFALVDADAQAALEEEGDWEEEIALDDAEEMLDALVESLDLGEFVRPPSETQADAEALLKVLEKSEAQGVPKAPPTPFDAHGRDGLTRAWHEEMCIALLPARVPSEIPAYLDIGGRNIFPSSEIHICYSRHWAEAYGADLVGLADGVLSFAVARPPDTEEDAMDLALVQYGYCPDTVDQGALTIGALAAGLRGAKSWVFWWD